MDATGEGQPEKGKHKIQGNTQQRADNRPNLINVNQRTTQHMKSAIFLPANRPHHGSPGSHRPFRHTKNKDAASSSALGKVQLHAARPKGEA